MLFTQNALLAQLLALLLGNSLQTGVGLCLLGGDEQEPGLLGIGPTSVPSVMQLILCRG